MRKILLFAALICSGMAAMAQQPAPQPPPTNMQAPPMQAGMFNPLVITKGQANIDGKNGTSALYNYSGSDSAWAVNFINIADNEAIVLMYAKKTASNLVITFPADAKINWPTAAPGITLSGQAFTLSSSANGTFQFAIQKKNGGYLVQISRTAP
jgi:hypothetical protein